MILDLVNRCVDLVHSDKSVYNFINHTFLLSKNLCLILAQMAPHSITVA